MRNGALWGELRYSAWGETRYSNGTIVTDRQYTGQVNDGATGLYYYNARYYDPALHRFIQADTIVPNPNDPQTLNRFSYTNNNPVNYTDPTGHMVDEGQADDVCGVNMPNCVPSTDPLLSQQGAAAVDAINTYSPVIYDTSVNAIRMVCEPCDMAATAYSWTQGDFHPADLAGFGTPFVSSLTARTGAGIIADGAESLARNDNLVSNIAGNSGELPPLIYRGGGTNPGSLTPRPDEDALSFRDSLSNPWPLPEDANPRNAPLAYDKGEFLVVDTSKLPSGSVVVDNNPPGHVSVTATFDEIKGAILPPKGKWNLNNPHLQ